VLVAVVRRSHPPARSEAGLEPKTGRGGRRNVYCGGMHTKCVHTCRKPSVLIPLRTHISLLLPAVIRCGHQLLALYVQVRSVGVQVGFS
jgi:hypothetical protein